MAITVGSIVFDGQKHEYDVLGSIGQGGFGHVYKCRERGKEIFTALKTLPTLFSDAKTLASFKNEAQMATEINHPNVIKYQFFHDGEKYPTLPPYILMEYADGGSLDDLIEKNRSKNEIFPNETVLSFFHPLVDGMEAINARLIHRDIKPDNMVFAGDRLKITDFGLSKLIQETTRTSTFKGFGTLQYIAPEAWKSEANTIQMDIYSMGLVFYELATLRYPYSVKNRDRPDEWMEAHLFQPVERPEKFNSNISPMVSQVLLKMVEKRTADRFRDWQSIRVALGSNTTTSSTQDASLIEAALSRRLEADAAQRASELAIAKQRSERELFLKLIASQFENDIVKPLEAFIDELNAKYVGPKASLSPGDPNRCQIRMPSGSSIEVRLVPILAENFEREVYETDAFGERFRRRKIMLPHLQGRKIIAWGSVSSSSGKGYNLILLEQPSEPYGEWTMLINTMGSPSTVTRRPEPFPFSLNELEEEIRNVGVIHVYNIRPSELDMSVLKSFVAEHF